MSTPTDAERWQAITMRDRAWTGLFVYAVRTTGIYCAPGCPARLPRRENVRMAIWDHRSGGLQGPEVFPVLAPACSPSERAYNFILSAEDVPPRLIGPALHRAHYLLRGSAGRHLRTRRRHPCRRDD
ncbi:MAG: hypothetical protein CVT80_01115 [Alphaproteobacteria bacterium HGW-Alphaproteobacteria-2]|nr:MAG: hypothetical protein CVT80_01115 [Alphaproteobacteria bacterium HGW-Alphaproteobacteria-2]